MKEICSRLVVEKSAEDVKGCSSDKRPRDMWSYMAENAGETTDITGKVRAALRSTAHVQDTGQKRNLQLIIGVSWATKAVIRTQTRVQTWMVCQTLSLKQDSPKLRMRQWIA